jgi:hypothetical protein
MNLEANKTYVFKDNEARHNYLHSHKSNQKCINKHYKDGFTLTEVIGIEGLIENLTVIFSREIQYFKLKEPKMLKPDEKVTVEMTALELVKLRHLMDGVGSGDEVSFVAALDAASKFTSRKPNAKHWDEDSEFHIWCLAQFQDPKQDRIDALKKTIADASAQIAAIRAESK